MIPAEHDLYCYRGQTYSQGFRLERNKQPIDLTGVAVKSHIRPAENSGTLIAEFTAVVSGPEGRITLNLTAEQTAALTPGVYEWDLQATDNATVKYWVRGKFVVEGRVTV